MMALNEYVDLLVKLALAFSIPLGWAFIFYPLKKKIKKSWYVLVISFSAVSFFALVLKEIMDEVTPVFDSIFTYVLGIFFSLVVISLFYQFRHKLRFSALVDKSLPKDETHFRKYKFDNDVHLRYLIQVALLIEEQSRDFYEKLAEEAQDGSKKNLFYRIAKDEAMHIELFNGILHRLSPMPVDKEHLDSFVQEARTRGILLKVPPPDAKEEDVIRYAIEQEEKTADFYLSLEGLFPQSWKMVPIQTIVMEERAHVNKLIIAYPQLNPLGA